jgi:hypothetical protein
MMTELDAIFASDLSLMVFMYGSAAMFIGAMAAVTWLCRAVHTDVTALPVSEAVPISSR